MTLHALDQVPSAFFCFCFCLALFVLYITALMNSPPNANAVFLPVLVYCTRQHHHGSGNNHCCARSLCNGEDQHQVQQAPSGIFSTEEDRSAAQSLQDHLRCHVRQRPRSEPPTSLLSHFSWRPLLNILNNCPSSSSSAFVLRANPWSTMNGKQIFEVYAKWCLTKSIKLVIPKEITLTWSVDGRGEKTREYGDGWNPGTHEGGVNVGITGENM